MFFSCILCVVALPSIHATSSYDQSQSGDLNVQVDLKGLHIIALMKGGKEDYVDYDYAYDYSEMTIKPQNGTTPKPLNATTSSNEKENTTTTPSTGLQESTSTPLDSQPTTEQSVLPLNSSYTTEKSTTTTTPDNLTSNTTSNIIATLNSTASAPSGCRKGFVMNQKGECELKIQSPSTNALLKLVKLSQKLKLRRERIQPTVTKA